MEKMTKRYTIDDINNFTADTFQKVFAIVVESWPDAAKTVATSLPVISVDELVDKFGNYLDSISDDAKRTILRLHPDLAGRLLDENILTAESASEQASAGLNKLSSAQKETLLQNNSDYFVKFGFPFVICVRANNKIESILQSFEARKYNDKHKELTVAIGEVKKICTIRIRDIVE